MLAKPTGTGSSCKVSPALPHVTLSSDLHLGAIVDVGVSGVTCKLSAGSGFCSKVTAALPVCGTSYPLPVKLGIQLSCTLHATPLMFPML